MTTIADLIGARFAMEQERGRDTEAEGTIAEILSRRSLRRYADQPVPQELLETLLACAQSAPSKSNLQQYSIVVVGDAAQRARLAPLCPQTDWLESCPIFLVFCADLRRNRRIGEMRDRPNDNDNMDSFLNAVVDAALAMQCFITAAESAGLGCAPISEVRNRMAELSAVLDLPDGVFPISGLTVGWPTVPGYINQRLPPQVVVHRDRYDDGGLEAETEAYDARRHAIFPVAPDKQRHTDKYGVLEVYGWSEGVARQLSLPERAGFRNFLTSHGFVLE